MLFEPTVHAPLTQTAWDEGRVRGAIRAIVADAEAAYDPETLWPPHEWDGWQAALPLKNLYVGAAGVAWALHALGAERLDPAAVALRALEAFRDAPDFMAGEEHPQRYSGLLTGESGILLVAWLLGGDDSLADALLARVRENIGNTVNDVMWGVPGTLLAARELHARTGEERWRVAVQESADAVRDARDADGLWRQRLWGETFQGLGPPHGLVGNVAALGEVGNAAEVLARRATREGGRANWGTSLQWCSGAPGIVLHAAPYLEGELLLAAAELIWDAGPKGDEKGFGICHGTSGSGYALLRTFERTQDEHWLGRARAFAVHALEQAERLPPRYSLFTGGVGAALFAADCLRGQARYPVLEGFGTVTA